VNCRSKIGPLGHPETMDKGLDVLRDKAKKAYAQGAPPPARSASEVQT
jgi:hypothetical protein